MLIESVMKREVISIGDDRLLGEAIDVLVRSRIGMLPVVNPERVLVGILRLRQVLELALPSFVGLVEDYDFVHDFGSLETGEIPRETREAPVTRFMEAPFSVAVDCGLLRAHAFMRQHGLHDVPVVDSQSRLVGLASWVDVGVGFLQSAAKGSGSGP